MGSGPHVWGAVVQEQKGLRADTYTYSLLMNGFAHARRPDMAFKLVRWQLPVCTCTLGIGIVRAGIAPFHSHVERLLEALSLVGMRHAQQHMLWRMAGSGISHRLLNCATGLAV